MWNLMNETEEQNKNRLMDIVKKLTAVRGEGDLGN